MQNSMRSLRQQPQLGVVPLRRRSGEAITDHAINFALFVVVVDRLCGLQEVGLRAHSSTPRLQNLWRDL